MEIQAVSQDQYDEVFSLLKENNLPVSDISNDTKLFALLDNNKIIGSIGLEIKNKEGLLRSLCIDEKYRNNGSAILLVNFLEGYARQQDIESVFLLTNTAERFFKNRDYVIIDRKSIPASIQQTSEFKSVCPSTATIMKKDLISKLV